MTTRIYTRTGDTGDTGLFGGGRVRKDDARVEAYGAVDELNAVLGWALTSLSSADVADRCAGLQSDLFVIGAHLATVAQEGRSAPALPALPEERTAQMEEWIDEAERELPELKSFIMPGGSPGGAALHVARTVCRRAERRTVELAARDVVNPFIIVYLNRLSDLLFTWARLENARVGTPETPWQPRPRD